MPFEDSSKRDCNAIFAIRTFNFAKFSLGFPKSIIILCVCGLS